MPNIPNGETANGAFGFSLLISFTKDPAARAAAAELIDSLLTAIGGALKPVDVKPLTTKVLAYLSKTGAQTAQAIAAVPVTMLADAVCAAPELVATKAGLAAILRAHQRNNRQQAAALCKARCRTSEVPPRVVLWEEETYRLEEATDPRHLQQDSAALGHCVGTLHNAPALEAHSLDSMDAEAIHYLHYWLRIQAGESRILTLTRRHHPVVTIEFDVKKRIVRQIEGRGRQVKGTEPFFAALCSALHAIKVPLAIRRIIGLPMRAPFLTKDGDFEDLPPQDLSDVLIGQLLLNPRDSHNFIVAAVAVRCLQVDITRIREDQLDRIVSVSGEVYTSANNLRMNALTRGDVHALSQTVSLPLFKCGDVTADFTRRLIFPRHIIGDVHANEANYLALPVHRAGDVYAPRAITVRLPMHQHGRITVGAALSVTIPAAAKALLKASRRTVVS